MMQETINEVYGDFERFAILNAQERNELKRLRNADSIPQDQDFSRLNQIRNEVSLLYQKYATALDILKQMQMQQEQARAEQEKVQQEVLPPEGEAPEIKA